eukprot:5156150-Pleurochrysis_carterae.AAC.1
MPIALTLSRDRWFLSLARSVHLALSFLPSSYASTYIPFLVRPLDLHAARPHAFCTQTASILAQGCAHHPDMITRSSSLSAC